MFIVHLCNIYILKASLCILSLTFAFQNLAITPTISSLQKAIGEKIYSKTAMQDSETRVWRHHRKPSLQRATHVYYSLSFRSSDSVLKDAHLS